LIVNADDLGLSDGVNARILEAHTSGNPRLGLGLLLDLDEIADDREALAGRDQL
jgi:predicted glycoside hydrolase/deacetylase ChbG (UPF0249 family)